MRSALLICCDEVTVTYIPFSIPPPPTPPPAPPRLLSRCATAPLKDETIKLAGQGHRQTKRAANADCWRDAEQPRKQIQTR